MRTGRTTQRVVCPKCGELLRPTPELLLGLDGIACKCGFRATDRLPGAQHPRAGPTRAGAALELGGGIALAAFGLAVATQGSVGGSGAVGAATVALWLLGAGGLVAIVDGLRRWRRAGRYGECARLLGDMVVRRSLVDGVRRIFREQGPAGERAAGAWLAAQGVSSPEFRRDLVRDARFAARA